MIYFDHNATSPLIPEAREAWLRANDEFPGNPSSPHRLGGRADRALEEAREELAELIGCAPGAVVFTSGATEANNLVLHHFAGAKPQKPIWISALEHPSVLNAATMRVTGGCKLIPALKSGEIDVNWIEDRLKKEQPALIAVMAANNETGVLTPTDKLADFCESHGIPLLSDSVQVVGRVPVSPMGKRNIIRTASAHKFGGPRGVGFLTWKAPCLDGFMKGGPQEEGRRAGTENVPGILGMVAAFKARNRQMTAEAVAERERWRTEFERDLVANVRGLQIIGQSALRLWNTVSVIMPEADCRQRFVVRMDRLGFAVSSGSACSSGKEKPSHVLMAMGFTPAESSRALRFSSSWETTQEDWHDLRAAVQRTCEELAPAGT